MTEKNEEERIILTDKKTISLRRSGTSDVVTIPSFWRKVFKELKGDITFDAHVEKDAHGHIFLVFEKVTENSGGEKDEDK